MNMKSIIFSNIAMSLHVVDTLVLEELLEKYLIVVFSGILFLKMLTNFANNVIDVNELATYLLEMKCLKCLSWFVKFFMYGGWTLWDLFLVP